MSLAEHTRKQETEVPLTGTVEHFEFLNKLLSRLPAIDGEQLKDFLRSNGVPESLSLLAFYRPTLPDIVKVSQVSNGHWLFDSRSLPTHSDELPSVRVNVSHPAHLQSASLVVRGQSVEPNPDGYDAYDLTIPLLPGNILRRVGHSLSNNPQEYLFAQLSKSAPPAISSQSTETISEFAASPRQLGALAVKTYRTMIFDRQNQADPSPFTKGLRLAVSDIAFCLRTEQEREIHLSLED